MRKAAKAGGNATIHKLMENLIKTYHSKVEGTPSDLTPVVPESVYYSEVYGKDIKDVSATC